MRLKDEKFYKTVRDCRFVNDVLHRQKAREDLLGRPPVERAHGEVIVSALPASELPPEVLEGIELV